MSSPDALVLPENLYWAWRKVRRHYRTADYWFDDLELATFEANLESELRAIAKQLARGHYRMSPLKPLAHPKKSGPGNKPNARQLFSIALRDQVAWVAFVNVIGPSLDWKMPPWSYGYRLYRHVWYEDPNDWSSLKIGAYRNSPAHLYRKFAHSWPLYRRHVYLTLRQMTESAHPERGPLTEPDQRELDRQLTASPPERLPYLRPAYWTTSYHDAFWCSVDLQTFFPRIDGRKLLSALRTHLPAGLSVYGELAQDLLRFPLDLSGWSDSDLAALGLEPRQRVFAGLPTGLIVAGFLANVAMLDVDAEVERRARRQQVAHFRYVDDHIFLAPSFERLHEWVTEYERILQSKGPGPKFNIEKIDPVDFADYLKPERDSAIRRVPPVTAADAGASCQLNPRFPAPLMTATLALVSGLARSHSGLLDERAREELLRDLEHLMVTEFPEHELRADTRVAFAAAMIARIAPKRSTSTSEIVRVARRIAIVQDAIERPGKADAQLRRELGQLKLRLSNLQQDRALALDTKRRHFLLVLAKALHEYPDKLRLWMRALEYCRASGAEDLRILRDEVDAVIKKNAVTAPYLKAFLLRSITQQVMLCVRLLRRPDQLPETRAAAVRYLLGVLRKPLVAWDPSDTNECLRIAWVIFRCGAGTAAAVIQTVGPEDRECYTRRTQITDAAMKLGAIDWQHLAKWKIGVAHPLSSLAWWAETEGQDIDANEPGPVWLHAVKHADWSDASWWSFGQRYPRRLPEPALQVLLDGDRVLNDQEGGWLFDVLVANPSLEKGGGRRGSTPRLVRTVQAALAIPAGKISLYDWAITTNRLYINNPFDPRVAEWTALEIARQTAEAIALFGQTSERIQRSIHPANFLVPAEWVSELLRPLTWEQWRLVVLGQGKLGVSVRTRPLLADRRLAPIWSPNPRTDLEWAPIRGIGFILLGLLRRDFDWPASWNGAAQQYARGGLTWTQIHRLPCSSWTAAILEACLTPWPRESILLPFFEPHGIHSPVDTTREPAPVKNLSDLIRCIGRAEEVLHGYQLTAQNHQPRQLVPLRLDQIVSDEWDEEGHENGTTV